MPHSPRQFFGRRPLADDVIIRWPEMIAYFEHLEKSDHRLSIEQIGSDWSGQPLVLLVIGSAVPKQERVVVAITAGVHAHELAGGQMMPDLVHDLLISRNEKTLAMLDRLTLLIAPCVNPGGLEIIADWRVKTAGTPFSGSHPPTQTHPLGHDLNRDWIVQTQPEARALVDRLFNRWRPRVVLDLHEMAPNGPRYALPPYIEPVDPNLPEDLIREAGRFGEAIASVMFTEGKTGVVTGHFFDGFSPARAYAPYHGGIRVLSEAAGTRLGRPIHLSSDEFAGSQGFDPRAASRQHRAPWAGGRWSLANAAAYHGTAIATTLHLAAELPPRTTESCASESCFVIPPVAMQPDPNAAIVLLNTLSQGAVELLRAEQPLAVDGVTFPAGTWLIDSKQSNWPWAKSLLEIQHYVLPESVGVHLPYDVTAQTLPLLMGVDVIALDRAAPVNGTRTALPPPPRRAPKRAKRVGIYQSKRPDACEAGWARSMLAAAGIESDTLSDSVIRFDDLTGFDVIILPHQQPDHLLNGLNIADYPRESTGGIGIFGLMRLRRWVADGGTLIGIDGACRALISGLNLPIEVVPREYAARGAVLRLELAPDHDIAKGCGPELAVMSINSVAFDIDRAGTSDLSAVARYPKDDPVLSGLLINWQGLAERAAIVEQRIEKGRILLFGCRPLFRGQSLAAQRLVVNAVQNARKGKNR